MPVRRYTARDLAWDQYLEVCRDAHNRGGLDRYLRVEPHAWARLQRQLKPQRQKLAA